MKKVTVFLCGLTLVFSVVGVAGASSITYTQSLDEAIIEGFTEPFLLGDSFSEVADDIINIATLEISEDEIDSDQNEVAVSEKVVVNSTTGGNQGSYLISGTDLYLFDNPALRSFNNRPTFFNGYGSNFKGNNGFDFKGNNGSNFKGNNGTNFKGNNGFDFKGNNGSGSNANGVAPVPEPSTILLLGAGLFGLVALGRRKFNLE